MNPIADSRLAAPRKAIPASRLPRAAVHPGRILRLHVLAERGLSQADFARLTGLPVSRINDILKERRGITVDAAIRIARVLGMEDHFWLQLQTNYERALAYAAKGSEYTRLRPLPA